MSYDLIGDAFFGSELGKLKHGTVSTVSALKARGFKFDESKVLETVIEFFSVVPKKRFGGPITAGDAFFSTCILLSECAERMLEIGVASGVSSAYFLTAAEKFGILKDGKWLTGVDISLDKGDGNTTGQVVDERAADKKGFFDLLIGKTTYDLLKSGELEEILKGKALVHIDANHRHPWPAIDVICIYLASAQRRWALMQDTQMMERWIFGTVLNGTPIPRPVRGSNLAFSHWPGRKIAGQDMCYNMGAVSLDVTRRDLIEYIDQISLYNTEMPQGHDQVARDILIDLRLMLERSS